LSETSYTSYNIYFLLPAFIWVICGGIALIFFDKELLFAIVNTHHSSFTDVLMYYLTQLGEGIFIVIILLLPLGKSYFRNWWYFLTALLTNVLPNIIIQVVKSSVHAPRPLKYFNEAAWIHTSPLWPRLMERSFPSGHTCAAFCLFCFLSFLLPYKYKPFGIVFFLLALLVGYSRIYLAAHFFLDVYVGSIIGTLFTTVIFAIMQHYRPLFFKSNGRLNNES
jgi:membrane-associated phospholipid phosphatase